jgi:hypothetical protein
VKLTFYMEWWTWHIMNDKVHLHVRCSSLIWEEAKAHEWIQKFVTTCVICEMFISYVRGSQSSQMNPKVCNHLCDIKVLSWAKSLLCILLFINFIIILSLFHCQFLTKMEGPRSRLVLSVKKKALWQTEINY